MTLQLSGKNHSTRSSNAEPALDKYDIGKVVQSVPILPALGYIPTGLNVHKTSLPQGEGHWQAHSALREWHRT